MMEKIIPDNRQESLMVTYTSCDIVRAKNSKRKGQQKSGSKPKRRDFHKVKFDKLV